MDRQTVINLIYSHFADAGDDDMNIRARLALLNITDAELDISATIFGNDEDDDDVLTVDQAHGLASERGL